MTEAPLLELEAVSLTFEHDGLGPVNVLSDISLSVAVGELIIVAGRSGSGKTTLLNIAAGLLLPTEGDVRWSGESIASMSAKLITARRGRHIGIVFQGAALVESLTASENVALALVPHGFTESAKSRAMLLLDEVGLTRRAAHFPGQLSGGERQRVAIARARFNDPALLLVDEPTANLDRSSADEVAELLVGLALAGRGIVVASHDPHLIERADRCLRLEP